MRILSSYQYLLKVSRTGSESGSSLFNYLVVILGSIRLPKGQSQIPFVFEKLVKLSRGKLTLFKTLSNICDGTFSPKQLKFLCKNTPSQIFARVLKMTVVKKQTLWLLVKFSYMFYRSYDRYCSSCENIPGEKYVSVTSTAMFYVFIKPPNTQFTFFIRELDLPEGKKKSSITHWSRKISRPVQGIQRRIQNLVNHLRRNVLQKKIYIYIYICMYIYCMYIYIYMYMYMYIYICMSYACIYIYTYVTHISICVCVCFDQVVNANVTQNFYSCVHKFLHFCVSILYVFISHSIQKAIYDSIIAKFLQYKTFLF